MTTNYALLTDATSEELSAGGVDPEAKREVPGIGYIHSDDVAVWAGVEPVDGTISLIGATLVPAADGSVVALTRQANG